MRMTQPVSLLCRMWSREQWQNFSSKQYSASELAESISAQLVTRNREKRPGLPLMLIEDKNTKCVMDLLTIMKISSSGSHLNAFQCSVKI